MGWLATSWLAFHSGSSLLPSVFLVLTPALGIAELDFNGQQGASYPVPSAPVPPRVLLLVPPFASTLPPSASNFNFMLTKHIFKERYT